MFRLIVKHKTFYCVRCTMAAYYVATDEDPVRAQENWYKDQAELYNIDKEKIKKAAPQENPICTKCGRRKIKRQYEDVIMRLV